MAESNQPAEKQMKRASASDGRNGLIIAGAALGSFLLSRVAEFAGVFAQVDDEKPKSGRAFAKGATVSVVLSAVSGFLGYVALSRGMESTVLTSFGRSAMNLAEKAGISTAKVKATALMESIKRNEAAIIRVEQDEYFGVAKETLDTSHLKQEVADRHKELSELMVAEAGNINLLQYIHDTVKLYATELESVTRKSVQQAERRAQKHPDRNIATKASAEAVSIEYQGAFIDLHDEVDAKIKSAMTSELENQEKEKAASPAKL